LRFWVPEFYRSFDPIKGSFDLNPLQIHPAMGAAARGIASYALRRRLQLAPLSTRKLKTGPAELTGWTFRKDWHAIHC
jgi:hypothetical protein